MFYEVQVNEPLKAGQAITGATLKIKCLLKKIVTGIYK